MTTSGCASLRHNLSVEEVVQAFLSALPIPPSATAEYDLTDEDSKQQIRVLKTGAAPPSTPHGDPMCFVAVSDFVCVWGGDSILFMCHE